MQWIFFGELTGNGSSCRKCRSWKSCFADRCVYLGLCLLLRIVLKRQAGKVSLSDLLVVMLVAGVCRNPLVKDDYTITDALLVIATVLLWSYLLDWMSYRFTVVHGLFHPSPVELIRDGQVLHDNLQGELMTETQLQSKLRRKGVRTPDEVAEAWLEGDGHVSVIKKKKAGKVHEYAPPEPCAATPSTIPQRAGTVEIEAFKQAAQRLIDQATRLTARG